MPLTKGFPQDAEAWKRKLLTPIVSRVRRSCPGPRGIGQAALLANGRRPAPYGQAPYGRHTLARGSRRGRLANEVGGRTM